MDANCIWNGCASQIEALKALKIEIMGNIILTAFVGFLVFLLLSHATKHRDTFAFRVVYYGAATTVLAGLAFLYFIVSGY